MTKSSNGAFTELFGVTSPTSNKLAGLSAQSVTTAFEEYGFVGIADSIPNCTHSTFFTAQDDVKTIRERRTIRNLCTYSVL